MKKTKTVDWLKIVSLQSFSSCHMVSQHRGADPNDISNSHFSVQGQSKSSLTAVLSSMTEMQSFPAPGKYLQYISDQPLPLLTPSERSGENTDAPPFKSASAPCNFL